MWYRRVARGAQGGVLGGLVVAGLFFFFDLLRLDPFATPIALSNHVVGPGGFELDLPVVSQLLAILIFGARLVMVTALHFFVFGLLGVAAVGMRDSLKIPLNGVTGAIFGLVICSSVFYLSVGLVGKGLMVGQPSLVWILVANAAAGGALGSFVGSRLLDE